MFRIKPKTRGHDAIIFAAPMPKKINPYSKDLYPDADKACCTFDAMDCIFAQAGEHKSSFDIVRKTFHEKVRLLANNLATISKMILGLPLHAAHLKKPIKEIENELIKKVPSSAKCIQAIILFYEKSHPCLSFLEFRELTIKFIQEEHTVFVILDYAVESLMNELKLDNTQFSNYQQEIKALSNKANQNLTAILQYNFIQKELIASSGFVPEKTWTPLADIKTFMTVLQKKGPMIMMGAFNPECYCKDPIKKTLGPHTFLAYPKNAFVLPKHPMSHTIVVLGASKKGFQNTPQDYIYYMDPARDADKEIYPVYMISYKNFCKRIAKGLTGAYISSDQEAQTNAFGYGYYHPQFVPESTPSSCFLFWQRNKYRVAAVVTMTAVAATAVLKS